MSLSLAESLRQCFYCHREVPDNSGYFDLESDSDDFVLTCGRCHAFHILFSARKKKKN